MFSCSGTLLWKSILCALEDDPINYLIQKVLLQDRQGESKVVYRNYQMKWTIHNRLDFVIVVVYQKVLQLNYIDEFIYSMKMALEGINYSYNIENSLPIEFEAEFNVLLAKAEKSKLVQKVIGYLIRLYSLNVHLEEEGDETGRCCCHAARIAKGRGTKSEL